MSAADFVSIHGRIFGLAPNGPVFNGVPVGNAIWGKGRYFYVHSGTDGSAGTSPETAVGTIDEAINMCTAARGDVVVVLPGHSETITAAGGIAADISGVTVVGLGTGSLRPTVLLDGATTPTVAISAAGVTFRNIVFKAGHADIVTCFAITAAGAWIDECEFVNLVVDENFLTEIKATSTTDNNADGLKVTNCRAFTVDANALEFIEVNADIDGAVYVGNYVCKDAATAGKFLLQATGKDHTNCLIARNIHVSGMTANDLFIDNDTTANSGMVAYNLCGHHDTASAVIIDLDGVRQIENRSSSEDTTSGLLLPVVDDNT